MFGSLAPLVAHFCKVQHLWWVEGQKIDTNKEGTLAPEAFLCGGDASVRTAFVWETKSVRDEKIILKSAIIVSGTHGKVDVFFIQFYICYTLHIYTYPYLSKIIKYLQNINK